MAAGITLVAVGSWIAEVAAKSDSWHFVSENL